ncbi:hypothetical protein KAW48_07910 [candidate division WOR-3 bacterium]|nr:hypothetical protein [candidate division WOR-3 bacterium]
MLIVLLLVISSPNVQRVSFSQGKRALVLPLHSLSSGVYFIRGKIEGDVILREKVVLIK